MHSNNYEWARSKYYDNIGYPKLFTVGQASGANPGPQATVNNFAAASAANAGSGWPWAFIGCIRLDVFPPRRARSANVQVVVNDFELIDRPVGRAWPSNDYSRGRCVIAMTTLLYCRRRVKPAGEQKHDPSNHEHAASV